MWRIDHTFITHWVKHYIHEHPLTSSSFPLSLHPNMPSHSLPFPPSSADSTVFTLLVNNTWGSCWWPRPQLFQYGNLLLYDLRFWSLQDFRVDALPDATHPIYQDLWLAQEVHWHQWNHDPIFCKDDVQLYLPFKQTGTMHPCNMTAYFITFFFFKSWICQALSVFSIPF